MRSYRMPRRTRLSTALLAACLALLCPLAALAQTATLTVADRGVSRTYTVRDLLASPQRRAVTVADPVFRRSMTYQAVPVADLLKGLAVVPDDYVQVTASDSFSVAIPARLLLNTDPAAPLAFLAIDDPAAPWPAIPGKGSRAGPFYVVWQPAGPTPVSSEYWAYATVSLTVTDSPVQRWPVLAVGTEVPAAAPIRRGLDRFVSVCMACHRFDGAGEAEMGPDLARPMNPVDYFQLPALRKFLHDPKSVRSWPDMKMAGAEAMSLTARDIDDIVAWLEYKARTRR